MPPGEAYFPAEQHHWIRRVRRNHITLRYVLRRHTLNSRCGDIPLDLAGDGVRRVVDRCVHSRNLVDCGMASADDLSVAIYLPTNDK